MRLKQLRSENNFSQSEIAERLGISRQSYINYELGKRAIDSELLIKMSELYGVSVDYILGLSLSPKLNEDDRCAENDTIKHIDLAKLISQDQIFFDGNIYKLTIDDCEKIKLAISLALFEARKKYRDKIK